MKRTLHRRWARVLAGVTISAALGAGGQADAGAYGSKYRTSGRCGPYPRAVVKTPPWLCLGIVAGPEQGMIWPRSILEIGEKRFAIADAAGWFARGKGRVLSLTIGEDGKSTVTPLITGRNLTHGLAMGPDGRVYAGDDDAIWRFDPRDAAPKAEPVLGGLPGKPSRGGDHFHPMKQIAFDKDKNLLVNMGSPNDACEKGVSKGDRFPYPCPWVTGEKPDAAIWKLEVNWPDGTPGKFEPVARGLRNSVAFAVHPGSGLVVQAENNIDSWGGRFDINFPPDEMNVIVAGRNYGWPYCAGMGVTAPAYKGRATCAGFEKPLFLIPAHAAPLALAYYEGAMFPELKGRLLATFHSSKKTGHRVVAYETDGDGRPKAPRDQAAGRPGFPETVVDFWTGDSGAGTAGRPSGLTVAKDGAIWLVDDVARTVMVLLRAEGAAPQPLAPEPAIARAPRPKGWSEFYWRVLRPRCQDCHEAFRETDTAEAWRKLAAEGMLDPDDLAASRMVKAMEGVDPLRPMPPPAGLAAYPDDLAHLRRFLETLHSGAR